MIQIPKSDLRAAIWVFGLGTSFVITHSSFLFPPIRFLDSSPLVSIMRARLI